MIYDKIRHIKQYQGISSNLDKAIEFLLTQEISGLSTGKHIIDGDLVFANVMDYDTKDIADGVKEAHKKYIDMHLMIRGKERFLVSDISELEIAEEYLEENDCAFYTGEMKNSFKLEDDYFMICFPNDVHTPGIKVEEAESVRKMVVKISV